MTQAIETFDLDNLEGVQRLTAKVPVVINSDGEDVSGFIILGKDSDEFQNAQKKLRMEGVQKSAKRKTMIDASTDDGAAKLTTLIEDQERRLALSVVVDWFGFSRKDADGQVVAVPFDKALVEHMFKVKPTWQAKVMAALEVDANFTKG